MIRPATAADAEACRRVARAAYAPYVARIGREPAPMVADFDAHVARDAVHVFEDAGTVVGYAVVIETPEGPQLENLAVMPDRQGRGIGSALIAHVEDALRGQGHGAYTLYTNVAMTESIALYRALGFRETRRVEEQGFSRVYFEKRLERPSGTVSS